MDGTTCDLLAQIQRMAIELEAVTLDRDFWKHEAEINAGALDHALVEIRRLNTPLADALALADTVVTPTESEGDTMPRNASNSRPDARFYADPAPPPPRAAPAPAAVTGTLGGECSSFCAPGEPCWVTDDGRCDAALSATAPATPPAAVTGTGGEDDTRRLAWLATELAYDWTIGEIDIAELACAYASDAGREDEDPIADDVIAALRLAIDTMMSPDTPQEADHAAQ